MSMSPGVAAMIARRLAAPKQFEVVTLYADGTSHSHPTETRAQADNYAVGERRNVGRSLIDRATGVAVEVVDVYIAAL
ncbi:hypothetical protein HLI01_08930 [Rhizobium laguerreae]|uniref:hypothetical protein n=1 Tax=Rhizobium laguerreae TaxID=1076926 RepID=UPI001478ECA1|nr:hypothetical protein [Rhizobium laguerreae]NNH56930.1 hypothetical protein [Rhizobium laguerreae]